MERDLLRRAAALVERGEAFALATVVGRRAPSSARIGDACLRHRRRRHIDVPITPEKVWRILNEKGVAE